MSVQQVRVSVFSTRTEAKLAQSRLEASGIPAQISADDAGGEYPQLQASGVDLLVSEANAEEASSILAELEDDAENASTDATPEPSAASEKTRFRGLPSGKSLLVLAVGAVLGFAVSESKILESWNNPAVWVAPAEVDTNQDGRTDQWWIQRQDQILRSRSDLNFDGKPDYWAFYEAGAIVRDESDANFDGKPDSWARYEGDSLAVSHFDLDFNGVSDETVQYEFGLPISARLHPNGGPLEREIRFLHGNRHEVFSVSPDGERTLIRSYDQVGRELIPE